MIKSTNYLSIWITEKVACMAVGRLLMTATVVAAHIKAGHFGVAGLSCRKGSLDGLL